MNFVRVALAAALLVVPSLSAETPKKAQTVDEVIERYHELHRKGIFLPLPATPDNFQAAAARTFDVNARRFDFLFTPSPFVVNQGDSVTLRLRASDDGDGAGHGFFLERYVENSLVLPEGQTFTINFVANQPGSFFFFCTVTCGSGHVTMSGTFTVNAVTNPPPAITSFSPASGPTAGGNDVVIIGTGFQSGSTVKFGSDTADTTFNSDTSITAVAPPHAAGPVTISVTNPDNATATSSQQYTYVAPPTITSISPASGSTAGGNNVAITGTGFQSGSTVRFGSDTATATFNSETSITAIAPPHAAGPVSITVTNPDTATATSAQQYTYLVPAPSIASVSPESGSSAGGTTLTITGTGFQSGATVKIGALNATNVTVTNSTTITATTPAGPANLPAAGESFDVIVTNPDTLNATKSGAFRYTVPPPAIAAISPNRGGLAGGTVVTITGAGFTSAIPPTVTFDGTAGTNVIVIDAVTLRATTPAHAEGAVSVVVTVGSASATATGGFTYATTPPKRRGVKS